VPLRLTEAEQYSCLRHLAPDNTQILHWHGDTFGLPEGATLLASTDVCANQVFSWGYSALALQFHAEITGSGLKRWFIAHAVEIRVILDVSVEILNASTARHGPALRRQIALFLCEWL
jgi:GMP synthase (glutamine-hydrolysing)